MTLARMVLRALRHYWPTHLAVILGLIVATAIITGALLAGDSIAASLRANALARLGLVNQAISAPGRFSAELGARIARSPVLDEDSRLATALIARASARHDDHGSQVPEVFVLGVDDAFWSLFPGSPVRPLAGRAAAVSESLARDLQVAVGDELLLGVERADPMADHVLFAMRSRQAGLRLLRVRVDAIVPDLLGGDFPVDAIVGGGGVGATTRGRNVFMGRTALADALDHGDSANAIFLHSDAPDGQLAGALAAGLALRDYGLTLASGSAQRAFFLECNTLLLTDAQVAAARAAAAELNAVADPGSIYLATRIASADAAREIAYAILATLPDPFDATFTAGAGANLPPDGVILNDWAAADLGARVGDTLRVTCLFPTPSGAYVESEVSVTIAGIVELTGAAAEPRLTPSLNGLTDATRIDDWKVPFPIDHGRVTARDDEYWERHRATPRVFVSPALLQSLWARAAQSDAAATSPGTTPWVTSIRLCPPESVDLATFESQFTAALLRHLTPADGHIMVLPLRRQVLAAATGPTDFGQLFLAMSFFLIVAAAALSGTLMRLLIAQRAAEIQLLAACGWRARKITALLLAEGGALTFLGVVLGVPAGILFDQAILTAMDSWWLAPWGESGVAATAGGLRVHVTPATLAIGAAAGMAVGGVCMFWALGAMTSGRPAAQRSMAAVVSPRLTRGHLALPVVTGLAGIALPLASIGGLLEPTVAFFGGGAVMLAALLAGCHALLVSRLRRGFATAAMVALTLRNAAINRGRSLLVIGLIASATFILVAVGANRRDFSSLDTRDKRSGAGGFILRATTSVPLRFDMGSPDGRARLGFSPLEQECFTGAGVMTLARSPGDDVSCLNLARPLRPRLLGITRPFAERDAFRVDTLAPAPSGNPWDLLFQEPGPDQAIPAFGDADSVQWTLHSAPGRTLSFPGPDGNPVNLKIVGVIRGSIFAGELLISDAHLRRLYPQLNGSNYFLFTEPHGDPIQLETALRSALADQGVEVRTTRELLNRYISVQNLYLSVFMTLGGLGLLLGTVGMVGVIARSVLERRAQLALMSATGFTRSTVVRLVTLEHAGLLAVGLLIGTATALLAVAPVLVSNRADVPWTGLAAILLLVVSVGLLSCLLAARFSIGRTPVTALRSE